MSHRVWADMITGAEATGTTKFHAFIPEKNSVLKAIRTAFVFYNDPTFTGIKARIYSDNNGVPGQMLAESDERPASIVTNNNAVIETWFEFTGVVLRGGTKYHVVFYVSGYSGAGASSHIALVVDWPNRSVAGESATTVEGLGLSPFKVHFFMADF